MQIRALITALGLNAVPAFGWYVADWSAGTTLLLYWIETLIGALLVAGRIVLHRRVRPTLGHSNYKAPKGAAPHVSAPVTYLSAFFAPTIIFTFGHAIFLGVLGWMAVSKNLSPEAKIDPQHLLAGLIGIVAFQTIDFAGDLIWLRTRPFRWIEQLGQQSFGRVIVIHLTLIGGMCAVMFTGANRDFFGVFIFLKTMLNLSMALPQYNPETPPAWLCKIMDRLGSGEHKEKTFAEFWRNTDKHEAARVERNETPLETRRQRNA